MGKALLGLRVERAAGQVTLWWSLLRSGPGYLLLGFGGFGVLTAAVDPHRRALYDMALGGRVTQDLDVEQRPRGLVDRLVHYAEVHEATTTERKKKVAGSAALSAWVVSLGSTVAAVLHWLRGSAPAPEPGPSVLGVLSGKASAAAAAALTAVATGVVLVAPFAEGPGRWLVTDRHWVGAPPSQDVPESQESRSAEPREAIARWLTAQGERYAGPCPDRPAGEAGAWCTTSPEEVTVDQVPALRDLGVVGGQVHVFAPSDSFHSEGALLLVEQRQRWRVGAVQLWLSELGEEPRSSRWIPAEVGLDGAYSEAFGGR